MVLNVVTPERRLAHSPAGDMALVAGLFVVALTYLDVPFWNALLFGPTITLQAAVGVVALTRLLKGVPGSLLLLLGPGLILGGALSFAIFQLVGRGALGLVVVVAVGIGAVAILISSTNWQPLSASRMWTLGQILGLAALALTWEFPELLPVAAVFFVLGFFTGESPKAPRWLAWTVGVLASVAIALVPILRQDYWWLITDDYNFFEVLSQHITRSGPFADWGVMNFSRYHWLSYGWNGLLNELGGRPETFTTLTRVMPFTYSTALAASLVVVVLTLRQPATRLVLATVPTWALIAIIRFDWSGLSTAGVYAALAAATTMPVVALYTNQTSTRRIMIYVCFAPIVALTKLPSIIALALLALVLELSAYLRNFHPTTRNLVLHASAGAGVLVTLPFLTILSEFVGNFQIVSLNPGLGQLSSTSVRFGAVALLAKNLTTVVFALVAGGYLLGVNRDRKTLGSGGDLSALAPLTLFGVWLDLTISGNTNAHEYFSGPVYFVGILPILYIYISVGHERANIQTFKSLATYAAGLLLAGLAWKELSLVDSVWNFIGQQIFQLSDFETTLLKFFTAEAKTGATVAAVIALPIVAVLRKGAIDALVLALSMSIVALTFYSLSEGMRYEFFRTRSNDEVWTNIGSPDARGVGNWIRINTDVSEVIASNLLYDYKTCEPLSDFSLASWSQREFLVLGPRFGGSESTSSQKQILLSLGFVGEPSRDFVFQFQRSNVGWFVVDKQNAGFVDWRRDWNVEYENDRFLVVRL